MESLIAWLASIPVWVAYLVAFAFPALEASTLLGILVPAETAMIAAGALAGLGRASVGWVALCGALGAIAGDSIGYFIGRRWGEPAMRGRLGKALGRDRWRNTKRHLERSGVGAIIVARIAPAVRTLAPGAAGAASMPYARFFLANAIGCVLWAATSVGLGWAMGRSLGALEAAHWIMMVIGGAIAVLAAVWLWRHTGRRRRARASLSPTAGGGGASDASAI